MVLFNYSTKELTAKVVYYGPALCGKTSNLQWIHEKLPIKNKGKMLSLATETDRTLFFDFLPIEIGAIRGMRTRIQLYTVPGQVFYNATRRMVLKGADAIVFVCDSQEPMLEANLESYENLLQNLEANELNTDEIPIVFQFNKRDLPNALPIEILNERLNPRAFPYYEAVAPNGSGVEETLKAVTKLVFRSLSARYGDGASASHPTRSSGGPQPGSLPGLAMTSGAPVAAPTAELLGDLSFTPAPRLITPAPPALSQPPSPPALSRPPSSPALSQPPPSPVLSRPPSSPALSSPALSRPPSSPRAPLPPANPPSRPATPSARRAPTTSLPDALQPAPEDLTMPSPSMHSEVTPVPRSPLRPHSPQETLVSSANEADELRRRISTPGVRQEEDLELEEIDLDDSLPMPQALPPDPEPSETVAPAPRSMPSMSAPAHTAEVEIPLEVQVPPGTTRLQLRLKLVLNLKQR